MSTFESVTPTVEETTSTEKGAAAADRFMAGLKKHGATLGGKVGTTIVTTTVATVTAYAVKKYLLDE